MERHKYKPVAVRFGSACSQCLYPRDHDIHFTDLEAEVGRDLGQKEEEPEPEERAALVECSTCGVPVRVVFRGEEVVKVFSTCDHVWKPEEQKPEPDPEPSKALTRYVDKAMFEAEDVDDLGLEAPKVYLLSATPDPLGAVAAASMMYEGRVVRDLAEITDDERRHYFGECFKTALKAPLEFVDFHLMVEGVTRAHSHQEVRQRTAVFAQESMRFAVKERIAARPGPLTKRDPKALARWEAAMERIWEDYNAQIAAGIPAEEARGLLPHDTLTRLHHKVNLRNLMDELGKRTCTQAQFDWRLWAASLRGAIADYGGYKYERRVIQEGRPGYHVETDAAAWQFQMIADSPIFQPICFNTGQCMFKAAMDRGCTIRERVEAGRFDQIRTEEWLMDPTAAWVR